MKKHVLFLSLTLIIFTACDKVKDPGIEVPKPIDEALISTYWNIISEKYDLLDEQGQIIQQYQRDYDKKYEFTSDHTFKRTASDGTWRNGTYSITREDKKDYLNLFLEPRNGWPADTLKYEVTAYTDKTMSWYGVRENMPYTDANGEEKTAPIRHGYLELHCPCRD